MTPDLSLDATADRQHVARLARSWIWFDEPRVGAVPVRLVCP